eukprot:1217141-Amphidinium_carterae.1
MWPWRAVTYNAQALTRPGRLQDLCTEFAKADVHVCGIQGTRYKSTHPVRQFRAYGYHHYAWDTFCSTGAQGHAGVLLSFACKRFRRSQVRHVYCPASHLQGRGGAVRIKGGTTMDFCYFVVYPPPSPVTEHDGRLVVDLWRWVGETIEALPVRCTPVLLSDANAHLGYLPQHEGDWQAAAEHPFESCVGPYNAQLENYNGLHLRKLLQRQGLTAVNTQVDRGSGPTFFGHSGSCSRIDYICLPCGLLRNVTRCERWLSLGVKLQLASCHELRDHVPLMVSWMQPLPGHHCAPPGHYRFDTTAARTALHLKAQHFAFLRQVEDRLPVEAVHECCDQGDVDTAWELLQRTVGTVACELFPLPAKAHKHAYSADILAMGEQLKTRRIGYFALVQAYRAGLGVHRTVGDFEHTRALLACWRELASVQRLSRTVLRARKRHRRILNEDMASRVDQCVLHGDWKRAWQLARVVAGTGLGPKRRRYDVVARDVPTAEEWHAHLSLPGPLGGCSATLWTPQMERAFLRDEVTPCLHDLDIHALQELNDHAQLDLRLFRQHLRLQHADRAVPQWSVAKEAWQLCLPPTQSSDDLTNLSVTFCKLLRACRLKHRGPLLWYRSQCVQLPKENGKRGCEGIRLIHLLDPVGRAWYAGLMSKIRAPVYPWACGFMKHRRREQAIQQQACLLWRAAQQHSSTMTVFYDVANAFPSPHHHKLDQYIRQYAENSDAPHLMARRHLGVMEVTGHDAERLHFNVGSGSLQGDTMGPKEFTLAYNEVLSTWMETTSRHSRNLCVQDPVTSETLDASMTAFADDVARTCLVANFPHSQTVLQALDEVLDAGLDDLGCGQNVSKRQLMLRFRGAGASHTARSMKRSSVGLQGKRVLQTKYLGSHLQVNNSNGPEIMSRKMAARTGFQALAGLWRSRFAILRTKIRFFRAMVDNALFSGLEAYVLTSAQVSQLSAVRLHLARRLLRGQACEHTEVDGHSVYKAKSNVWVLHQLHLLPTEDVLRIRRLKWLQQQVLFPSSSTLLRAVTFGHFSWEPSATLVDGRLSERANPWALQWDADVQALQAHAGDDLLRPLEVVRIWGDAAPAFLSWHVDAYAASLHEQVALRSAALQVPREADLVADAQVDNAMLEKCNWPLWDGSCQYEGTRICLFQHCLRHHPESGLWRQALMDNGCLWCARVFSARSSLLRHVQQRLSTGKCAVHSGRAYADLTTLLPCLSYSCPLGCVVSLSDSQAYRAHIRTHTPFLAQCCARALPYSLQNHAGVGSEEDSRRREQHRQAPQHLTEQTSAGGASRTGGGYRQALLANYTETACTGGRSDGVHATSRRGPVRQGSYGESTSVCTSHSQQQQRTQAGRQRSSRVGGTCASGSGGYSSDGCSGSRDRYPFTEPAERPSVHVQDLALLRQDQAEVAGAGGGGRSNKALATDTQGIAGESSTVTGGASSEEQLGEDCPAARGQAERNLSADMVAGMLVQGSVGRRRAALCIPAAEVPEVDESLQQSVLTQYFRRL